MPRRDSCDRRRVVRYQVSPYSSVRVRRDRRAQVGRVRRSVRESGVRCIPRVLLLWDRVPSEWVLVFHRQDLFVRAAARVRRRADLDNAMFRAA